MTYSISLKNLTKVYKIYKKPWHRIINVFNKNIKFRKFHALNNLTIDLPKGEAIGVLGKNGAGKSTLLKIITGVTTPTNGQIKVNGTISALLELTSGFDLELTGLENVYLKALAMGISKSNIEHKIPEIIDFADIGDYIYQPVRTYSSGMKSRLGFAISVNVNPDILIVDEVLAVGDDIFKLKCIERMREFKELGKTILFVSHSLFTVKSFCSKAIWIKDGQLVEYGEVENVIVKYENYLKEEQAKEIEEKKRKAISNNTNYQIIDKKDIIEFTDFKMLNQSGQVTNNFSFREDIAFEVNYEVKKKMKGLKWCFTIRDADTKEIFGSNKRSSEHLLIENIGEHLLKVKLTNIKLLPGKYLLSGEVRGDDGALHIGFSNKTPFNIKQENFNGTGIIYIDHKYDNY